MFQIAYDLENSPKHLTQAVVQAAELLGLYNAELARVLGLMCNDIGRITSARDTLAPDTDAWQRALLFLRLYRVLDKVQNSNEVAMYHWLRARNVHHGETPLIEIVDHGGLAEVVYALEKNRCIIMIEERSPSGWSNIKCVRSVAPLFMREITLAFHPNGVSFLVGNRFLPRHVVTRKQK